MSWSFGDKGHPANVRKHAADYFSQPWLSGMDHAEYAQMIMTHAQIVLAAENMPPDFYMRVNAYGSQKTYADGKVLTSLTVNISFHENPKTE